MKKESEELVTDISDREQRLKNAQSKNAKLAQELEEEKKKSKEQRAKLDEDISKQNNIVREKSIKRADQLNKEFVTKWGAWTGIFAFYGFFVTFLMGFTSETFSEHFKAFWGDIWTMFVSLFDWSFGVTYDWSLAIDNSFGAWCVENILGFIIALVPLVMIYGLFIFLLVKLLKGYTDRVTALIGLLSLALLIFLSVYIPKLNTVVLWLIFMGVALGLRRFIDSKKKTI